MIELLSLPRRPTQKIYLPDVKFQSGLPINSLPGWEHIPLNLKLPMLKCPGNEVIFSKNKIGQSLRHAKYEFDSSGHDSIPEYNPLHDSNLKTFYANERNLKRLRENCEITSNNDVICTLKDFNEYRQQLHKSKLSYILREFKRLETEHQDRLLMSNAEKITDNDHQHLSTWDNSYARVVYRKFCLDQQRAEKFQRLHERTLQKCAHIQMVRGALQHEKALRKSKYEKNANVRSDLQRKQFISLKKLFQFKTDRLHRNLRKLKESRMQREQEKEIQSWNKRLAERIANQKKVDRLLAQVNERKRIFMENHKQKYQREWSRIQQEIKERSLINRTKFNFNAKKRLPPKQLVIEGSLIAEFKDRFEKLLDSEVCEALNTALDLEKKAEVPFEPSDPIYRAAQYIMRVILKKFNRDLSKDEITYRNVYNRIEKFFDEAKKFVIFRATQIIASFPDDSRVSRHINFRRTSVSFSKLPSTIGMSSYQIHPLIDVKGVSNRQPTPAGSLTSIIVDSTTSLAERSNCNNLSRNELIFIEHYIIKLKRELIVGVGRKVFAAIQCHYEKKIMDVRQELLDIDREFLLNQATKSILTYAINPLNFESAVKLCCSALSSDIIWSLQRQLLKPTPDRRRVVKPGMQRSCRHNIKQLCLFCKE